MMKKQKQKTSSGGNYSIKNNNGEYLGWSSKDYDKACRLAHFMRKLDKKANYYVTYRGYRVNEVVPVDLERDNIAKTEADLLLK